LSTDVLEVRAASIIALMMEAARTSETSVDDCFTRQYIPEDNSEFYFILCSTSIKNCKVQLIESYVVFTSLGKWGKKKTKFTSCLS
jgi:hypothetical protein